MSTTRPTNLNWDKLFQLELQKACELTRKIIQESDIDSEESLAQFNSIAYEMYEKFKDSPLKVRPPNPKLDYLKEMVSTSFMLRYGCMNVPYYFIGVFKEDPNFSFAEEFEQELKWHELIGLLQQKWLNRKLKLTKTSVLICKALSRYNSEGQVYRFPITHEIIANRTRQSLSIIKLTFPLIFTKSIVRDLFLINPWKLGWGLYLISYPYQENYRFDNYNAITIGLEICSGKKSFRIIQYPLLDSGENLSSLKTIIKEIGGNLYHIKSTDFHWDLSQLHQDEKKSFSRIPKFLYKSPTYIEPNIHYTSDSEIIDWYSDSIIDKSLKMRSNSEQNDIDANNGGKELSDLKKERIIKVLNYLVEYGIPMVNYEVSAEKIGLTINEFGNILRYLIKSRVITLGYRFKHIGAGYEYCFLIENSSSELNRLIKQNLLQCIFSYFYESENILAGRIQVPDKWVAGLLEFFTKLQMRFSNLTINYGQRIIGYNFFNPNVSFPKNYILNEFGMYAVSQTKIKKNSR